MSFFSLWPQPGLLHQARDEGHLQGGLSRAVLILCLGSSFVNTEEKGAEVCPSQVPPLTGRGLGSHREGV